MADLFATAGPFGGMSANPPSLARRVWRRVRRRLPARLAGSVMFSADDIESVFGVYRQTAGAAGTAWDAYREAHMRLPAWFQRGLDPWSVAYRDQQLRLWRLVTGIEREYDPQVDEQEVGWDGVDPVRRPGYYLRRDAAAIASASDHVLATGMLLKHCGLKVGDRALEYGAGFAQTALALARLGVTVDTVDISEAFCGYVRQQADFFQVPLTPHRGAFGMNPLPGQRYRLIWFYESFHHCLEFQDVVPRLGEMLEAGGRVILGGEPIVEEEYEAVPYPWGVRLHSEVVAVMRQTRWCELGFSEAFLYELFRRSGFAGRRVDCPPSLFGRLYIFDKMVDPSDSNPSPQ